ncbi:GNAT family N-acetyltransferase [Nocardioides sp. LML1-1-1.1]|uniref:GNAT family N-acetyltransferase n=1 Tax=Nocardioides sp. LML1-1-1.1 TaxID=3135248 RepID=UPI00342A01FA
MPVTVRPATAADVDGIVAVGHAAWPPAYTAVAGADYVRRGLAQWWSVDHIAQAVADGLALVAVDGPRVVGVATYSLDGDVVDVWKLYVLPSEQGRGIGRALLRAVAEGPGADAGAIRLAHLAGNAPARAFYERQGFTETHRTTNDEGGPDHVWLRLSLRK